ncbi:hypothetical protein [Caldibacillus debilis]|uniref:hypothetical protein n=1 Tax=Caldibacillus debilis TaxID=301148 RepID=UPI00047EF883|nr:hypothetical protein [Caldibacillus debilis]
MKSKKKMKVNKSIGQEETVRQQRRFNPEKGKEGKNKGDACPKGSLPGRFFDGILLRQIPNPPDYQQKSGRIGQNIDPPHVNIQNHQDQTENNFSERFFSI